MDVKLVLFLLSVVVTTSLAQKPCCYPNQFEVSEGATIGLVRSGKGSAIGQVTELAYDYTNKRTGELITTYGENYRNMSFIQVISDFNTNVEYLIESKEKHCQKLRPKRPMARCVYENATYGGSIYLGDKKLIVDTFTYFSQEGQSAGQVSQTVTKGDCIPSSFTFVGVDGETSLLSLTGYYNHVSGIKDPAKYFTVPDYCPQLFSNEPRMYQSLAPKMIP